MRRLGLVLGFLVCLVLVPLEAYATSCWRPSPAEHIEKSDVIFFGEVKYSKRQHRRKGDTGTYTFRVIQAYKGIPSDTVEIAVQHPGKFNWDYFYHRPKLIFANNIKDEKSGATVATIVLCGLTPYAFRERLHPEYWELLVALSKESDRELADGER